MFFFLFSDNFASGIGLGVAIAFVIVVVAVVVYRKTRGGYLGMGTARESDLELQLFCWLMLSLLSLSLLSLLLLSIERQEEVGI